MKAMVYHTYGSPDVLHLEEVETPTPKDDEVLIQVHAAAANARDWRLLRADPFLVRLMGGGLLKPKNTILGADVAGRVEAVGRNVTQFRPGDEVFGDLAACGTGSFAENVSVPEHAVALKPANLTFAQAAAVPMAAITASKVFAMPDIFSCKGHRSDDCRSGVSVIDLIGPCAGYTLVAPRSRRSLQLVSATGLSKASASGGRSPVKTEPSSRSSETQ